MDEDEEVAIAPPPPSSGRRRACTTRSMSGSGSLESPGGFLGQLSYANGAETSSLETAAPSVPAALKQPSTTVTSERTTRADEEGTGADTASPNGSGHDSDATEASMVSTAVSSSQETVLASSENAEEQYDQRAPATRRAAKQAEAEVAAKRNSGANDEKREDEDEAGGEEDIVDDDDAPSRRTRLMKGSDALARASRFASRGRESFPSRQTRQSRLRRGLEASPYSVGSFIGSNGKPIDSPWSTLAEAQETVGRRVKLYWGGDKKWYAGKIVLVHPTSRQCFIKYDDHDERWHAMWEECYEWLPDDSRPPPRGPTPPRRSLAQRMPR